MSAINEAKTDSTKVGKRQLMRIRVRSKTEMRVLVVTIVMVLPTMVIAEDRIPDNLLRQHNESCVAKCSESRSYVFCAETCACMVGEMERHWTAKDFQDRSKKLSKSDNDRTVQNELGRMADFCAERTMRSAQQ